MHSTNKKRNGKPGRLKLPQQRKLELSDTIPCSHASESLRQIAVFEPQSGNSSRTLAESAENEDNHTSRPTPLGIFPKREIRVSSLERSEAVMPAPSDPTDYLALFLAEEQMRQAKKEALEHRTFWLSKLAEEGCTPANLADHAAAVAQLSVLARAMLRCSDPRSSLVGQGRDGGASNP